jgi:hypothetical protein
MRITSKSTDDGGLVVTITLSRQDDDPRSCLDILAGQGLLQAFLRAYGRPDDLGGPDSMDEASDLLTRYAYVVRRAQDRLEDMQLAARDQWGLGWGAIARAVDLSRSTVKGQIQASRARYADNGLWYDAAGRHQATPRTAHEATGRAWDQDGKEPYLDADDPGHWPGHLSGKPGPAARPG